MLEKHPEELKEKEVEQTTIVKQLKESKELIEKQTELNKLREKRIEMEKVLSRNNSHIDEILHPEKTKIPKNLIHGGHRMIQHAGFVNPDSNYIKLKQTINNVSLNDILLESKSLLNRLKNN
jgi:hypothetical protein